jgi:predicted esterase
MGKEYQARSRELRRAFEEKDYLASLEITKDIRRSFPEHSASACFDMAYTQALLGDTQDSITTLEEAYDEGGWWPKEEFDEFPSIERLMTSPRFRRILKKFQERCEEERNSSGVKWIVRTPPRYDSTRPYPVLFALHWRGSNMNEFEPYWRDAATRHGVVLVVPQSSQVIGHNEYTWHDVKSGLNDLEQCYNEVGDNIAIDSEMTFLGGASIGGMLALEATFVQRRFPVRGVVAVIPHRISISVLSNRIEELAELRTRCCIVTGTEDSSYEPCQELTRLMEELGTKPLFIESTGTGHIIPPDFDEMLDDILPFLLT